ncbi:MAG: MFS transporter [Clostridiales bacterium]|jgi:MFS family permease|nr:MFS transporter [Clostridiales bacterium]
MLNWVRVAKVLHNYVVFWLGQTLSQIGSATTSFAIVLWVYDQTKSPLSTALLSVFTWIPKIAFGLVAGSIVDRANKKAVVMISDSFTAIMSCALLILFSTKNLCVWHIYAFNILTGVFSCLQYNASEVVQTVLVPKQYYIATSGMRSFTNGASGLIAPALGAALYVLAGMRIVIIIDICTFFVAAISLIVFVRIPKIESVQESKFSISHFWTDFLNSAKFLKSSRELLSLTIYFCFVNLLSGITYFSLLSPMILGATGNNANTLALVSTLLGFGMIVGSFYVTLHKESRKKMQVICLAVGLSFALGDIVLAIGNTAVIWCVGAFFSSFFIPLSNANESFIWRTSIPIAFQGRVFSARDAIQQAMRPIGMLLGGFWAEYFFEPNIVGQNSVINVMVGNSSGSGIAFMFLLTGVLGVLVSLTVYVKFRNYVNE